MTDAAAAATYDERRSALDWAERSRCRRAALRDELRAGRVDLERALELSRHDDLVGTVKLLFVLESLPGARKTDTRRTLARLGIDPAAPVGRLDDRVLRTLLDTFSGPVGPAGDVTSGEGHP
jgi:hypothetical protein